MTQNVVNRPLHLLPSHTVIPLYLHYTFYYYTFTLWQCWTPSSTKTPDRWWSGQAVVSITIKFYWFPIDKTAVFVSVPIFWNARINASSYKKKCTSQNINWEYFPVTLRIQFNARALILETQGRVLISFWHEHMRVQKHIMKNDRQ